MFGGITFMVNGKMRISAGHQRLMCRIDPERHETAIARRAPEASTLSAASFTPIFSIIATTSEDEHQ